MVEQKILPVLAIKDGAVLRYRYDLVDVKVGDVKFEDGS